MNGDVIGRHSELRSIAGFLDSISQGPAVLILEGEAGIGKTTLWDSALVEARRRHFRVLACQPAETEARLSYASLTDLLSGVEQKLLAELPAAQREALDVALLHAPPGRMPPDHRAIATALVTVLNRLSVTGPLLLAVDDVQWLDRVTTRALEFAVKRVVGPIGVAASMRVSGRSGERSQLRPADPSRVTRLEIGPLTVAALHQLLKQRSGRTYSRPALVRIREASGGNPFFALELVRVLGDRPALAPTTRFPTSVAELARTRFVGLDARTRKVLLAVSALAIPSIDALERIDPAALALLERAEELDIIQFEGVRVRFVHPILASAAYAMASPADRRAMHRRLADAGLDIEERARHLALASVMATEETTAVLDEAAAHARSRGATAAAADLLELALRLGADDPARRIRAARHHFDSGDPLRARALLEETVARLPPGNLRADALRLLATVRLHDDSYREAAALLEQALSEVTDEPALRVRIHLELLYVLVNLGRVNDAVLLAEPVIRDAEEVGDRGLVAQALAASTISRFLNGQGLDGERLERALALEDRDLPTAIMFRPSLMASLLWMWVGDLDRARGAFYALRRDCLERGEETDLMFVAFHTVMLECWRGDLVSARQVADDTYERALQLGTAVPLAIALSMRANAAAYEGNVAEARESAEAALEIFMRGSCLVATLWPLASLGFVELSLDDFEAASNRLGPMAAGAASMGVREPACIPFAADAAEALIALGRLDEASALVDQLVEHGGRLDRVWALATGGRCRALLQAAQGDIDASLRTGEQALREHDRVGMPFERARTLLVLGRLQRRQGRRSTARTSLDEALRVFDAIGSVLWADKARAELRRLGTKPGSGIELTPTERRVAEMTASGLTNREVAAALLVSPKTVEANLSRIYQKLHIRSRAELGRRMAEHTQSLTEAANRT